MLSAVDGKAAAALEHEHHCVAAGGVCADLLALGEGEQRDADGVILGKRLADDLPASASTCCASGSTCSCAMFFRIAIMILLPAARLHDPVTR